MSTTDTEIKAKLFAREDSTRFKLQVPLQAFLDLVLTDEQRALLKDAKPDVYLDSRHPDEADGIIISFYVDKEARPDAQGVLVEQPPKPIDRCATKSELAELRKELESVATIARGEQARYGG